uniref:DDE Tnp4 domain-containing protein n=1 Tax=Meloidogyne hapla TaxID=6305 RepID=A0A1I8BYX4_MELHA
MGSAISHYGNDMHIDLDSTGLKTSSIAPNGIQIGPRQHKKIKCALGITETKILDFDLFIPHGASKCSNLAVKFGPEYKLLGSEEREEKKITDLDQEANTD